MEIERKCSGLTAIRSYMVAQGPPEKGRAGEGAFHKTGGKLPVYSKGDVNGGKDSVPQPVPADDAKFQVGRVIADVTGAGDFVGLIRSFHQEIPVVAGRFGDNSLLCEGEVWKLLPFSGVLPPLGENGGEGNEAPAGTGRLCPLIFAEHGRLRRGNGVREYRLSFGFLKARFLPEQLIPRRQKGFQHSVPPFS